jgi:hypothetical protein
MSPFLIRSVLDPSLFIAMKDNALTAEVGVSSSTKLANQWEFEVFPAPSPSIRGHYLESTTPTGDGTVLVIDTKGASTTSGTPIHVFHIQEIGFSEPLDTQCWIFNESKSRPGCYFINSFANRELVIAIEDGVKPQPGQFQPLEADTAMPDKISEKNPMGPVPQLWTFVTPGQNGTTITPPSILGPSKVEGPN